MSDIKIPKRISTAILNSLNSGVVPRIGLEYITVGRKKEIQILLNDLENIKEGGACFRFICGKYGSGKSFLIQVIRNHSLDKGFVTCDTDLTPERKLAGKKQGLATYRELIQNMAIAARPDGGALESILQRWIQNLKISVMKETDITPDDPNINNLVKKKIFEVINNLENQSHGYDFSIVISSYWDGYNNEDETLKQASLRWLKGEFATKTEAKTYLRVDEIINDTNWYDYIKLYSNFVSLAGYNGLILFIDEAVNLYKTPNRITRENNYEKLLSMFNDTMQGKASHLGIYFGATPKLIEDTKRGLFSYEALRTRLSTGNFTSSGRFSDLSGPVMPLTTLSDEEVFVLLHILSDIHSKHYGYAPKLKDDDLIEFMKTIKGRIGTDELLTPREVTRDFISILNIMEQNEDVSFKDLLNDSKTSFTSPSLDPDSENDDLFEGFQL
ncbi:MAG: ATP-binding protein [Oscillospiraceae bacterium]|nr:ATP-binding protein [Oscillospiraceae bacterium]